MKQIPDVLSEEVWDRMAAICWNSTYLNAIQ